MSSADAAPFTHAWWRRSAAIGSMPDWRGRGVRVWEGLRSDRHDVTTAGPAPIDARERCWRADAEQEVECRRPGLLHELRTLKLGHRLSLSTLDGNLLVRHARSLACNHIINVLALDDRSKGKHSREAIRKYFTQ